MNHNEIKSLFDSFNQYNVAVIGDVMLDKYIFGKVSRISPEAPVPVVEVNDESYRLGGAANVAMNLHAMGAQASLFGITGKDTNREILINEMRNQHFSPDYLLTDANRKTTCKTRVIAQNHHIVRIDSETKTFINKEIESELISHFQNEVHNFQALIFEDYNKGLLTSNLISQITQIALKKQLPILVDPKKNFFFDYKNCTVFKPNLKETIDALNTPFQNTDKEVQKACETLKEKIECEYVVLTRGEKGLTILDNRNIFHIPSAALDVADVSGAGDTVIGVLTLGLCSGLPIQEAGRLANFAAGIVCSEVGAVSIDKHKLLQYCLLNF